MTASAIAPQGAAAALDDGRPGMDTLVERARALVPWLRENARRTESERRVSADAIERLKAAGLFRVVQPRRFGGWEYSLADMQRLAFEVSRGCGSTGWCYSLSATNAWVFGMLTERAQHDIWDADADALGAASIAPTGTARRVDGGYMVKGQWGFASNCDNASWLKLGCRVQTPDGAAPSPSFMLMPASDCRILDNWDTVGLAGTGSKDIVIDEEVFVPEHRSVDFADVLNQRAPGARLHANPMFRIPFLTGFPPMLATPAVGALAGAVDEFVEQVAGRRTRGAFLGAGPTLSQFAHVQTAVAEAEAAVDAANLLLQRDLDTAQALAADAAPVSQQQRILFRRNQAFAVKLCVQGIDALYDVVGGSGISLDSGVQRAWRDVHAVAHHISMNWNAVSTMYGQMRLGLEPRGQH